MPRTRHPQPRRRRSARMMLSLSSFALLSACGGGGEGEIDLSSYLPDFPAPPAVESVVLSTSLFIGPNVASQLSSLLSSTTYQNTPTTIAWLQQNFDSSVPTNASQDPIRTSGAAFAHAAGLTGAGQFIAISDRDIDFNHEAISSRVFVDSTFGSDDQHGTAVASVAVGNSTNFVGVAPGASVWFGTYESERALADLGQWALSIGAVAWNNSWGYTSLGLNQDDFDSAFDFNQDSRDYLAALDAYSGYGVVVFSASNESLQHATLMDGLPVLRPTLEAGWIAAVNGVPTFSGDEITSVHLLSNACWEAARWCLIADGSWNAATGPNNEYEFVTGSSFAAPQIAGAMALLAEAFGGPGGLTPHELRVRLLASARDDFFTPDATVELADGFNKPYSVIYGHGFLDIEAALKPIGGVGLPTPNGAQIDVNAPILMTGSGLGDAVEVSLAATNLAVKDALSAGFVMPGTALTSGARPGSQAGALLAKALRSNLTANRTAAPAALSDPFAAFTGPVLALSAPDGTTSAAVLMPQGDGALGFTLTRALTDGPTKVELGLKLARDNGGLLSLGGEEGAAMASVALGVTQDLGNGAFMAVSGEMGLTDLGGDTALGDSSSARFDAVKLTAGQSDIFSKGDRLSVGVGMPIAIASGETVVDLPVSRAGLAADFEAVALDLAPDNRQLDLEVTYQTALADGVEMQLSLIHSDNFGNRAGETDTAGALAFAFRF